MDKIDKKPNVDVSTFNWHHTKTHASGFNRKQFPSHTLFVDFTQWVCARFLPVKIILTDAFMMPTTKE